MKDEVAGTNKSETWSEKLFDFEIYIMKENKYVKQSSSELLKNYVIN